MSRLLEHSTWWEAPQLILFFFSPEKHAENVKPADHDDTDGPHPGVSVWEVGPALFAAKDFEGLESTVRREKKTQTITPSNEHSLHILFVRTTYR